MFKQTGTCASTKVLRKTKANESYKIMGALKPKVMLTDLCPEEKAKVGELVRALEVRKTENLSLEQQIKQLQTNEKHQQNRIEELERVVEELLFKQKQYKEQITLAQVREQEKERYISHLQKERQSIKKVGPLVEQYCMTEAVIKLEQGCQATQKKKKQKSKQVQTEAMQQMGGILSRSRGRGNSKSFEKIMRKPVNSKQLSFENSRGKSAIRISDQDDEKEAYRQEYLNQEDSEEDFDELAKKWLELKERNMSKIKDSIKRSNVSGERKTIEGNRRSINPQGFDVEESEGDEYENESFGPKKHSKINQFEIVEQQFDEVQLNRILKSKNFSASRLLHKRPDSETSRQHSVNSEDRRNPNSYLNTSEGRGQGKLKTSTMSNNIDFYETDLLDIVNSIKP